MFARALISSLFLTVAAGASAQATRTWVSGVGDDANPCSRTAPCKTFAGAISKTAANGEIDVIDPGGFGALTITKSITIDGGGFVSSILVSGTSGVNINAGISDKVTLRNISINGLGSSANGVNVLQAGDVHLENVTIVGFTTGISVLSSSPIGVTLDRVVSRDNSDAALNVAGPSSSSQALVSVHDSSFLNSGSGVFCFQNAKMLVSNSTASTNLGAGFRVGGNGALTVTDSTATGNGGAGFQTDSSSGNPTLTLVRSTASTNVGPGLQGAGGGSTVVRLIGSALLSNGGGISATGTVLVGTYGDNEITNGITGTTLTTLAKQ